MQTVISSFLERSMYPQQQGLKYIICPQSPWERILGWVPFQAQRQHYTIANSTTDNSTRNNSGGKDDHPVVLSPDETSIGSNYNLWTMEYHFTSMTFLGQDHELTIHDFLTFTVMSYTFHNPCISAIVTYTVHCIQSLVRAHYGAKNLAKKTFLNPKFLLRR
jgi:Meckelin (Transmembrane protein 67).